ncbi:hypothetical protein AGLY_001793 [Aphis glycines]|uniref:HAT C-terminal dimerisation domain-containing protein n=1 Tax=Aphis glycines TaxID=307491 RepID=A0A6G0U4V1_APHGL|nr:hypothetical protein AGLY_001793 [Aphis glycines]
MYDKRKQAYSKLPTSTDETIYQLKNLQNEASHQAIIDVFGNIKIIGCRFHLGQSWWIKILSEPFLRIAYMDNSNELGKWLKMCLAFISPEEVFDAFHELISICPNDDGFIFSDYVLHNYIVNRCQIPLNIWAEIPSPNPKTTIAAESFHRTYNSQFYSPHPYVHAVTKIVSDVPIVSELAVMCLTRQPNINLISESCINLANRFSSDIESGNLLKDECNHFKIMISAEDSIDSSYKMLSFIKKKDYFDIFPNLPVVLRMYLSTALTNCSGERSFSALKRIKNCLRSTTTSTRLNALSLLNIENELLQSLDYSDIITEFATRKSRKTTIFS